MTMEDVRDVAYYAENPEELLALTESEQEAVFNGTYVAPKEDDSEEISEDDLNLILEDDVVDAVKSKDGEHTIPYEELKAARQSAHESRAEAEQFKALADQQAQLIADLQTAKNQDVKDGGGTEAQDDVIEKFKAEFGELIGEGVEGFSGFNGFEKYLKEIIGNSVKPFQEKSEALEIKLKEIETAKRTEDAIRDFSVLKTAHPDIDSLTKIDDKTGNNAIGRWIESLPKWDQEGKWQAAKGSVEDKIALLQMYKDANGIKPEPEVAKSPVTKAATKAPVKTVKTLSSMTGETGELSDVESFMALSPTQQRAKLANMPLEQQEALYQKMQK